MSNERETPYDRLRQQRVAEQKAALPLNSDEWHDKMKAQRQEARKARMAEIAATLPPLGKRPHCMWCTKELPVASYMHKPGLGYSNNGKFCTLRCGFYWAVKFA